MIINYDYYWCEKCKKCRSFDTSKPYSKICPVCNKEMKFKFNLDGDTERAEWVKKQKPYNPRLDPRSPFFVRVLRCPFCGSVNNATHIDRLEEIRRTGFLGLFGIKRCKNWRCDKCGGEFD